MGSFQQGFQLGSQAWDDIERSRIAREELGIRKAAADREAQRFNWQKDDRQRVDSAVGSLDALTQGVYTGADARFGEANPAADAAPLPDGQPTPAASLRPRRASPLELNQAAQRVALANRDMTTWSALNEQGRKLHEDEVFSAGMKNADDPSSIAWVNQNHKSVTIGQPDKNGVSQLSVVTPTGNAMFANLSKADRAKIAGAVALMDLNPTRALQTIAEVNGALAATLAAENGLALNVGKANNEGAYHSGMVANGRMTAQAAQASAGAAQARVGLERDRLNRESIGRNTRQMVDPQGNVHEYYSVVTPNGVEWRELAMDPGMKPYNPRGESPLAAALYPKFAEEISVAKPEQIKGIVKKYQQLGLPVGGEDPILAALKKATGGPTPSAAPDPADFSTRTNAELARIATKPRGVSSAEASAARDELERRKNEPRMTAF